MEDEVLAEFSVVGMPPTRQRALTQKDWEEIKERRQRFQEAVQKVQKKPMAAGEEIAVYVRFQRAQSDEAALDILRGVMEALRQVGVQGEGTVTELAYLEQEGGKDAYWVEIMRRYPSSEPDQKPHAWAQPYQELI